MNTLIEEIDKSAEISGVSPQDVITDWVNAGQITAKEEEYARAHFGSLTVKPHETPTESTSTNLLDVPTLTEEQKAEQTRDAEFHKTGLGQRNLLQWNPDISPVTNVVAHPLAAFSAGVDKVASAIRPDYPNRTFSENYDLAMEKYQKRNPANPRNIWDSAAITGTEMLGEGLLTAGIAPAVSIWRNVPRIVQTAKPLKDAAGTVNKLQTLAAPTAKPLKDAAGTVNKLQTLAANTLPDLTNRGKALAAYAFPRTAQTAKPLKDAADVVSELPGLYTNPYLRGAVENAVFAGIDPELSKADVAANVVAGLGATKALTRMPWLTGQETRKGFIDDGVTGVRQVIDAPKQGAHADRYADALPWVLENLETRHWHGGGPMKTLQNLKNSADEAMETALNVEVAQNLPANEFADATAEWYRQREHAFLNPKTYYTEIGEKVTATKINAKARAADKALNARIEDATNNLRRPFSRTKVKEDAFETLSFVYDRAMKLVNDPDPVLKLMGEKIIGDRDTKLRDTFGKVGAEKIKEALFKKSVADSYKTRIRLGEITAAKKNIHRVANEHVFAPFIKAADLGESPNMLSRAAYPIVKEEDRKRIDWLKSYTQPF